MKWARRYYKSILIILVLGTSIFSGALLTSQKVNADAVTGSTGVANLAERWIRYRAITGCYSIHDVGGSNVDEISAGTWLARGGGNPDDKVSLGYLNEDGKVSCGDGAFVSNSLSTIGFSSNLESFCGMRTATRGGSHDEKRCIEGPGEFDMDGSKDDQVRAFKDAKGAKIADSAAFPYEAGAAANQSIMYYIGLESLKKFCGGSRGEKYTDSMAGNVRDAKKKVVVNEVDLADGKIVRYVYNLDKDETDNIDRLWANTGRDFSVITDTGNSVKDEEMSCTELAQLTWKYDEAFSTFVKKYNLKNPADKPSESSLAGTDGAGGTSGDTTCAVDGVGWIVCPVMTFLGKLNDLAFGFLNNFLEVRPAVFNDKATKLAWDSFRNIANVAFVIAFLIIIYSQITGAGMANYGIKKMIPKLIIAAILVNVSFYVCAVLIDISNIAGASLYSLLTGFNIGDDGGGGGTMSGVWNGIIGSLLGVTIGIGLLALIVFAPMSLLAFALVILILIARQAFVILLIVISPLAFVAYLLPNTEDWFKKWWKALVAMLMVYPVIAVVFGASTLASTILLRVAEDGVGGGDDEQMLKIIAAAVLAMPLFAVPALLKGSMAAAGSIGGKLAGLQDKTNRGASKAIKEGRLGEAKSAFDTRRRRRQVDRRLGNGKIASWGNDARRANTRRGKAAAVLGSLGSRVDQSSAGRYLGGDRGAAAAVSEQQKLNNEAVERSMSVLQNNKAGEVITKAQEQLKAAHDKGDEIAARAATRVLAQGTGARGIDALHKTLSEIESSSPTGALNDKVADDVKHEVNSAGLKAKNRSLDKWSRDEGGAGGGTGLNDYDADAATTAGLNESEITGHSVAQLRRFGATAAGINDNLATRVLAAHAAGTLNLDNDKLEIFQAAAANQRYTPPPPGSPPGTAGTWT